MNVECMDECFYFLNGFHGRLPVRRAPPEMRFTLEPGVNKTLHWPLSACPGAPILATLKLHFMLSETLKEMGVVGAGGSGFPTHVKAASQAEFLLANGAECEPLLHKDFEIMCQYPKEILSGMALMMESTGARTGMPAVAT